MPKCTCHSPRAVVRCHHITHGMHVPRFRQPHQNDRRWESSGQRKAGAGTKTHLESRSAPWSGQGHQNDTDRQGGNVMWLGADMGMDRNGYIAVKTVADPSPARRADMRSGDRVLSINEQPSPATRSERHNQERTQGAIRTRCVVMHMERTAATRSSRPDKRPTRPLTNGPAKSPPRKNRQARRTTSHSM